MEENEAEIKYPATCVVHWPTGAVKMCLDHARQLVAVGKALGTYIYCEETGEISNCSHCEKEAEKQLP